MNVDALARQIEQMLLAANSHGKKGVTVHYEKESLKEMILTALDEPKTFELNELNKAILTNNLRG